MYCILYLVYCIVYCVLYIDDVLYCIEYCIEYCIVLYCVLYCIVYCIVLNMNMYCVLYCIPYCIPYCPLSIFSHITHHLTCLFKRKSKTCPPSLSPTFSFSVDYIVPPEDLSLSSLRIQLCHDGALSNTEVGRVSIPLDRMMNESSVREWFMLVKDQQRLGIMSRRRGKEEEEEEEEVKSAPAPVSEGDGTNIGKGKVKGKQ